MPTNIKQVIGNNIRTIRKTKGLSQVEFGDEIGKLTGRAWSAQTVSGAESGKREFVAVEVVSICCVLDCTIGDLIATEPESFVEITENLTMGSDDVAALSPDARAAIANATDAEIAAEVLRRMADGHEAPLEQTFSNEMNK